MTFWGYFSRKLQSAETCYSVFGRELMVIYATFQHFRHLLEGREFHVMADHKPLTYVFSTNSSKYVTREIRHLAFIEFTTDICIANALYRVAATGPTSAAIDWATLSEAQRNEPKQQALLTKSQTRPSTICAMLSVVSHVHASSTPFIPAAFRRAIFNSLHDIGHPGTRATQYLVT